MNILFLCVGNSARSQIAEGLAKEMFPESFHVESAGSMPANSVHDGAIKCMHEIGIDISNQYPKKVEELDDAFIKNLDFVITLCAEEICPIIDKSTKRIQTILYYGSLQVKVSQAGTHLGALVGLDGI